MQLTAVRTTGDGPAGGRRGGATGLAAPALALALGGAVAVAGWIAAGTALGGPLVAFGVGAAALGGGVALTRLGGLRRFAAPARAFHRLYGDDDEPQALTDGEGALIAVNAALRRAAGGGPPPRRLEAMFEGGGAELYRLGREASRRGRAVGVGLVLRGANVVLVVRRVDGGRLIWRMRRGPVASPEEALEALHLPAVLCEGGRLEANAVARDVMPALAEALDAAAASGRSAPEPEAAADASSSIRAVLGLAEAMVEPAEEARRAALALPAGPGRRASPGWMLAPRLAAPGAAQAVADSLERLPVALARLDLHGAVISANAPARRLLGPAAAPGVPIEALAEGLGRSMTERVAEAARGRGAGRAEIARGRRDDRETFLQISFSRIEVEGEAGLIAVLGDATELKTLEAQFVQSQKMQAVGQLAGGVAHDFNNLLTAILGHCDLLLMRRDAADADHADLVQIRQNANRAAALVRQMLAFSRKQTLQPSVLSLSETLDETSHLLNRLIGEKVRLTLAPAPDLGLVRVDQRQFEQVIVNLVVNARDAMPAGGEVRVAARNCTFKREMRRGQAVVPPGDYVLVEVADSGEGIPADRLDKIFEPFFTTKRTGEGTGLGLSTAYGIVKQTGGFIFADSVAGEGATFSIYLPRHAGERPEPTAPAPAALPAPVGPEGRAVLLVEDEAAVRAFAARALSLRGYEVREADSAESALALLEEESAPVDVIVSDVVMPGLDGPSFVRRARAMRPGVAVVFVSGYAEDVFRRSLEGLEGFVFLPKPYELKELVAAIRDAAAAAPSAGAALNGSPTAGGTSVEAGDEGGAAALDRAPPARRADVPGAQASRGHAGTPPASEADAGDVLAPSGDGVEADGDSSRPAPASAEGGPAGADAVALPVPARDDR